jgi:hypothetical protein
VADLTNERPNCYLEVGYAMGMNKFTHLILTAREDHNQDNPGHKPGDPKIHFDLSGYPILWWHQDRLDDFHAQLEKEIRRRLQIPHPSISQSPWNEKWLPTRQEEALAGLKGIGRTGFMEIRFALSDTKSSWSLNELLKAANRAQTSRASLTLGKVAPSNEHSPQPDDSGIVARICEKTWRRYYYWSLSLKGDFYQLMSLGEDTNNPQSILFDVRIERVVEALLYCTRLYSYLGLADTEIVHIGILHAGLKGRSLGASPRRALDERRPATVGQVDSKIQTALKDIQPQLVELTKELTAPLFEVFGFTKIPGRIYEEIADDFSQNHSD